MLNFERKFAGNQFAEIIFRLRCKQNILMVPHGNLRFDAVGLGLSEFISIIENAGQTVATALRADSGVVSTIAGSFNFDIAELRLPFPHPCTWDQLLKIGFVAEEVITKQWGPGAVAEIVDELIASNNANPALSQLVKAQQNSSITAENSKEAEPSLLPLKNIRRVILGSIVNQLAQKLPEDEAKLASLFKRAQPKLVDTVIAEAIDGAEQAIGDYLQRALKQTAVIAKNIRGKRAAK